MSYTEEIINLQSESEESRSPVRAETISALERLRALVPDEDQDEYIGT